MPRRATDAWTPKCPAWPIAVDDPMVIRLAAALATPRPWQRVTDPEKATVYFRSEAIRRLLHCRPDARERLVADAEADARRTPRVFR